MRLKGLNSFKIIFTLVQSVLFNTNLLFQLGLYYKKTHPESIKIIQNIYTVKLVSSFLNQPEFSRKSSVQILAILLRNDLVGQRSMAQWHFPAVHMVSVGVQSCSVPAPQAWTYVEFYFFLLTLILFTSCSASCHSSAWRLHFGGYQQSPS